MLLSSITKLLGKLTYKLYKNKTSNFTSNFMVTESKFESSTIFPAYKVSIEILLHLSE